METLKKIILVCLLIASVGSFAQTSKYQSAMHRSYEFEQAKNYTNAIADEWRYFRSFGI